jgi:hypothetical protein
LREYSQFKLKDENYQDFLDRCWRERLQSFKDYYELHGHVKIPYSYIDGRGQKLKSWVYNQNVHYREKTLSSDRRIILDNLNIWKWEKKSERKPYDVYVSDLKEFINKHSRPPIDSTKLGRWYQKQKSLYRVNELSDEQISLFRESDISLKVKTIMTWDAQYQSLVNLGRIPSQSTSLGMWCYKQKRAAEKGSLLPERRALLDKLDFWSWAIKVPGAPWGESFRAFKKYVEVEGRLPKRNGLLGAWFFKQRQRIREGTISIEQHQKLKAIEGWIW